MDKRCSKIIGATQQWHWFRLMHAKSEGKQESGSTFRQDTAWIYERPRGRREIDKPRWLDAFLALAEMPTTNAFSLQEQTSRPLGVEATFGELVHFRISECWKVSIARWYYELIHVWT
ncbi:MAG: hypothetical protein KDB03_07830 [Planctomycetales bacterium]|nr:hypothetical protein [Planctomycetales bacterium]